MFLKFLGVFIVLLQTSVSFPLRTSKINSYCGNIKITIPEETFSKKDWESFNFETEDERSKSSSQVTVRKVSIQEVHLDCTGNTATFSTNPVLELILHTLKHNGKLENIERICITNTNPTMPIQHNFLLPALEIPTTTSTGVTIQRNNQIPPTGELVDWIGLEGQVLSTFPRTYVHQYNLLHSGIGAVLVRNRVRDQIFIHKRSATKRLFPEKLDMFIGGVCQAGEGSFPTLLRELREECGLDLSSVEESIPYGVKKQEILSVDRITNTKDQTDSRGELGNDQDSWNRAVEEAWQRFTRTQGFEASPTEGNEGSENSVQGTIVQYIGSTLVRTSYNQCLVYCYCVALSDSMARVIHFPDGEIEWGRWVSMEDLLGLLQGEGFSDFVPDGMQVWNALPGMLKKSNIIPV